MPVSNMDIVERIARVIAGRVVSINAEGDERLGRPTRSTAIWRDYRDDAVSILRTLREPDPAMAAAGDVGDLGADGRSGARRSRRRRPHRPSAGQTSHSA